MKDQPQHADLPFGSHTVDIAKALGCQPYQVGAVCFGQVEYRSTHTLPASLITGDAHNGGKRFHIPGTPGAFAGDFNVVYTMPNGRVNANYGSKKTRFAGGDLHARIYVGNDPRPIGYASDTGTREAVEHAKDCTSYLANDSSTQELNERVYDNNDPLATSLMLPYTPARVTGVGIELGGRMYLCNKHYFPGRPHDGANALNELSQIEWQLPNAKAFNTTQRRVRLCDIMDCNMLNTAQKIPLTNDLIIEVVGASKLPVALSNCEGDPANADGITLAGITAGGNNWALAADNASIHLEYKQWKLQDAAVEKQVHSVLQSGYRFPAVRLVAQRNEFIDGQPEVGCTLRPGTGNLTTLGIHVQSTRLMTAVAAEADFQRDHGTENMLPHNGVRLTTLKIDNASLDLNDAGYAPAANVADTRAVADAKQARHDSVRSAYPHTPLSKNEVNRFGCYVSAVSVGAGTRDPTARHKYIPTGGETVTFEARRPNTTGTLLRFFISSK